MDEGEDEGDVCGEVGLVTRFSGRRVGVEYLLRWRSGLLGTRLKPLDTVVVRYQVNLYFKFFLPKDSYRWIRTQWGDEG